MFGSPTLLVRPPHADLHPAKRVTPEDSLYRPDASVAAVAALHAHAYRPQRQVHVVVDDDTLPRCEVEPSRQLRQDRTRDIDVCQRLDQIDSPALQFDAGQHHLFLPDPLCPKGAGKKIEHCLADVMRCVPVLVARIAQSDNRLNGWLGEWRTALRLASASGGAGCAASRTRYAKRADFTWGCNFITTVGQRPWPGTSW